MPFYSKDWRSPGEEWVKTAEGWEMKKILECRRRWAGCASLYKSCPQNVPVQHENRHCGYDESADKMESGSLTKGTSSFDKENVSPVPPYCHITLKCTREIAGFNGFSDALQRLDFRNAVRDTRRFQYIVKLLDLLLSQQRIVTLSGNAQKRLLAVLEEVALQVQSNQQNTQILKTLLAELNQTLRDEAWWGQILGSSQLWGQHVQTIDRISAIASNINIDGPTSGMGLKDLPHECIRELLRRLADDKDLANMSEASPLFQKLVNEQSLWRRLASFHFTPLQIDFMLNHIQKENERRRAREKSTAEALLESPNTHHLNTAERNRPGHPYRYGHNGRRNSEHVSNHAPPEDECVRRRNRTVSENNSSSHPFQNVINRQREIFSKSYVNQIDELSSLSDPEPEPESSVDKPVSFQDVRNHFARRVNQYSGAGSGTSPGLGSLQKETTRPTLQGKNLSSNVEDDLDWQYVFQKLRKRFGLREEYAEVLHLCRSCCCLFWKSYGHPCIADHPEYSRKLDKKEALYVPIPPQAFLQFFSL